MCWCVQEKNNIILLTDTNIIVENVLSFDA